MPHSNFTNPLELERYKSVRKEHRNTQDCAERTGLGL